MSEPINEPASVDAPPPQQPAERIHPVQRLMDNPWLLLFLCLLVGTLSYTAWGWWELATVPPASLP